MVAVARHHVVFLGAPGVHYEEWRPPPALAPWVAVSWRIATEIDFDLRIPPDGCMDLIGGDVSFDCSDGITCTVDSCNPTTSACEHSCSDVPCWTVTLGSGAPSANLAGADINGKSLIGLQAGILHRF